MGHPLIYVMGNTEEQDFPLILTIGREPNYDDELDDTIAVFDNDEFKSMSGGVWVTAYTQIAKQYFGEKASAADLRDPCLARNASPIVYTNAFPMAIRHEVADKDTVRKQFISKIPGHIEKLFNKPISNRIKLVIHHGVQLSEPSELAAKLIQEHCAKLGFSYCATPFFHNANSAGIQQSMSKVAPEIKVIFDNFFTNVPC